MFIHNSPLALNSDEKLTVAELFALS